MFLNIVAENMSHSCTGQHTKAGASTLKCMHCTENPICVFREMASSYIHVSVSNLYIPRIGLPI
jgi:hypothetical protein